MECVDMSKTCGDGVEPQWAKWRSGKITFDQLREWHLDHCWKCIYHDLWIGCMYEEQFD